MKLNLLGNKSSADGQSMKVGTKVMAVVSFCLVLLAVVAGASIWQMGKIGDLIADIAERDIPLTTALTNITVRQLEQAVNFERGVRTGEEIATHPAAREEFAASVGKFEELTTQIAGELTAAVKLAEHDIAVARTAEDRAEFEHVLETLKKIAVEHADYDKLAIEALKLIVAGNTGQALTLLPKIEAEQENLNHTLAALLVEIGTFTEHAATAAEEAEQSAIMMLSITSILAVLLGIGLAWFIVSRSIVRPLAEVGRGLDALIAGDTSVEVRVYANDEIGAVAKSFVGFKENLVRAKELEAEQAENEKRAQEEKHRMMNQLADDFDASVGSIVEAVTAATAELQSTAESMSGISAETSKQATAVSAGSQEATTNVQTVAAAAEEMSQSIGEINQQVAQATAAARQAVEEVAKTSTQMEGLADSADKIGDVIKMISDIAEQTNLLALNATIESARAGEAGKGFAVVASEVKSLAGQTAKAAEDIIQQINAIQQATREAVTSMGEISTVIGQVDETSTVISAAMEEQGATTQEIARNVQEAAAGTEDVTRNVEGVSQASQEAGQAANQVTEAANELSQQATKMKTDVDKFMAQIRAA